MEVLTHLVPKTAVLSFIDHLHPYLPVMEQERLNALRQQFQALPDDATLFDCLLLFLVLGDLCWVAIPTLAPTLQSVH